MECVISMGLSLSLKDQPNSRPFLNASILAMVIDKSFQEGTFPEQLKIAKVIPIHKEESRQSVGY